MPTIYQDGKKVTGGANSSVNISYKDTNVEAELNTLESVIGDSSKLEKSIVDTVEDLKKSGADGKTLVANAISEKGVSTSKEDSFETMATKIKLISGGEVDGTQYYDSGYSDGITFADGRVNTESASYTSGYGVAKTEHTPTSSTLTNSGNLTLKNNENTEIFSKTFTNSYDKGMSDADARVNTSSASYIDGYNVGGIENKPTSATLSDDGKLVVNNEDNSEIYTKTFSNSYNKGVTDADNRINSSSASYEAGEQEALPNSATLSNSGVLSVKNKSNVETYTKTFTNNYDKGVSDADARVNSSSASYTSGYSDGMQNASEEYAPNSATLTDSGVLSVKNSESAEIYSKTFTNNYNKGKTDYNPTDATLSNAGALTVKNSAGTSRLTKTFTNNYDAGVSATKKGTASASDVLETKTFTNASSVGISGSLKNKKSTSVVGTYVSSDGTNSLFSIPEGAYDKDSRVSISNSNLTDTPSLILSTVGGTSKTYTFTEDYRYVFAIAGAGSSSNYPSNISITFTTQGTSKYDSYTGQYYGSLGSGYALNVKKGDKITMNISGTGASGIWRIYGVK